MSEPPTNTFGPAAPPGTDVTKSLPASADTQTQLPAEVAAFAARLDKLAGAVSEALPPDRPDAPPGYELLAELGRGGMGIVYRARQVTLNREVAFKTVLHGHASRTTVARFWAEAEVMAAVKHPHVVQVFELGESAGRPFMAMELVTGGTLAERVKAAGDQPAFAPLEAAALMEQVARGVAAAHELGIVHRDLKPGNVLLDAAGKPKVTDFGLAKWRSTDLTRTQALMGTPAYMAPEQAAGRAKFVGPTADVWALGVMLYECISGERPFEGDSSEEVLANIQSTEPSALRTRVREVPRDLETIVVKCLTKEPDGRYASAAELADDLARLVRGEPIAARRAGRVERLARWARRKPTLAAAWVLTMLSLVLAGLTAGALTLWRTAELARDGEKTAKEVAEQARDGEKAARAVSELARDSEREARRLAEKSRGEAEDARNKLAVVEYGRTMQVAHQEWRQNNILRARNLLEATAQDLRDWEWRYLHRLCHSERLTLRGHAAGVTSASWSPDGMRVVTGSQDTRARVWDARTGSSLLILAPGDSPVPVKVVPGGDGRPSPSLGETHRITSSSWSGDGKWIAIGCEDGTAVVWDATTGKEVLRVSHKGLRSADRAPRGAQSLNQTNRVPPIAVLSVSWNPDSTHIVTASADRTAAIWNARTGAKIRTLEGHLDPVTCASWSPNGTRLLTGSEDGTAKVWDASAGTDLLTFKGHAGHVTCAAWSPDGVQIVTGGSDRTSRVWDANTGATLITFKGHSDSVSSVSWSPDGMRVSTGSDDRTAMIWDAKTGGEVLTLKGHIHRVTGVSWAPDGKRIVTGSLDWTVRLWETEPEPDYYLRTSGALADQRGNGGEGKPAGLVVVPPEALNPFTISVSPDGTRFVTPRGWTSASVVDVKPAPGLRTLEGHTNTLTSASWSPNGTRIVTGSNDRTAKIWEAHTGIHLATLVGHAGIVTSASFSNDGSRLVTSSWDRTAMVWNAGDGAEALTLRGHTGYVRFALFSADGTRIVTGSDDRTARVWDTRTGAEILKLEGHASAVLSASISPDNQRAVTSDRSGAVKVWDLITKAQLTTLKGHTHGVLASAFSPDGTRIVTGSADRTAKVWDARTGAEVLSLTGHHDFVTSVSWSGDGSKIISCSLDGTAKIWDATPVNDEFLPREVAPAPREAR